ncbi:hypothetical protein ABK040_009192 [Willaertia magna]
MVKLNYNLGEIKYIACANNFTIIVNKFHEFYYAGEINRVYNNYTFKKFNPVRNLTTIKFIRTFGSNCFIVTKENLIYCIGYNANGLLGLGSQLIGNVLNFTKIKDLNFLQGNEIKDLQTSLQHSIILDFNGNIYGCGNSNHFQMSDQLTSQQSQSDQFLHNFTKINFNTKIKKILCPECATILLDENNELFVVGANFFGRFGLGNLNEPKYFTKVVMDNINIDKIYLNYNNCFTLLQDFNNNFYFSGKNIFGIKNEFLKEEEQIVYFTKINLFNDELNIYPLLGYFSYFICSDYKIKKYGMYCEEEINYLGIKTLQTITQNKLTDITILF